MVLVQSANLAGKTMREELQRHMPLGGMLSRINL
jgi:hypothetical protein